MTFLRKIADVLAVVFHPVFLFFYVFLSLGVLLYANYWLWFGIVLAGTVALPIIITVLSGDIHMSKRERRYIPLLLISLCYIGTFLILLQGYFTTFSETYLSSTYTRAETLRPAYDSSYIITLSLLQNLLAIALGVIFLTIANFSKKVSLHAGAFGFLIVFLIQPTINLPSLIPGRMLTHSGGILIIAILTIVISTVLWQRIKSGAHTRVEVAAGLGIGILTSALVKFTSLFYWLI